MSLASIVVGVSAAAPAITASASIPVNPNPVAMRPISAWLAPLDLPDTDITAAMDAMGFPAGFPTPPAGQPITQIFVNRFLESDGPPVRDANGNPQLDLDNTAAWYVKSEYWLEHAEPGTEADDVVTARVDGALQDAWQTTGEDPPTMGGPGVVSVLVISDVENPAVPAIDTRIQNVRWTRANDLGLTIPAELWNGLPQPAGCVQTRILVSYGREFSDETSENEYRIKAEFTCPASASADTDAAFKAFFDSNDVSFDPVEAEYEGRVAPGFNLEISYYTGPLDRRNVIVSWSSPVPEPAVPA